MGIGALFAKHGVIYEATTGRTTGYSGITSPWSGTSHLAAVQLPAGIPNGPVTTGEALSVPPVARAVQLISTVAAALKLEAVNADGTPTEDQPLWLDSTYGAITARHRTALMIQHLFFTGSALLWTNQKDDDGYPLELELVPRELWNLDERMMPQLVDGQELDPRNYVYVPALMPQGFLEFGADSVREYRDLSVQIGNRARVGKPLTVISMKDPGFEPTEEEAKVVVNNFVLARQAKNGAVAFVPGWAEASDMGNGEISPLSDARNQVRLDVANFANINAAMLDGNNGTSDTYSNTLQNMNELLELTMRQWLTAIEQRFSQDDVTPPGTKIRFDTSHFDQLSDASGNAGTATPEKEKVDESPNQVID